MRPGVRQSRKQIRAGQALVARADAGAGARREPHGVEIESGRALRRAVRGLCQKVLKAVKRKARKFKQLEDAVGYKFKSEPLLERALTHASVRSGKITRFDNERLEFVGDRVLGLAVAEMLSEAFPDANEGELARRYNRLVRGESCARVARRIGLGPCLILSDSEAESGGREKDTILADAMEAVLGAIFLDAGFDKARSVVRQLWQDTIEHAPQVAADPKSALQEWSQGRGLELPVYVEVARKGPDHAPRFTSEVRISGVAPARGEGASKRAAEQAAASTLLTREGVMKGSNHE